MIGMTFVASIYDVEAMIAEESFRIGEDSVIKALNDYFVDLFCIHIDTIGTIKFLVYLYRYLPQLMI